MSFTVLTYEVKDQVAQIMLNRPKAYNSFNSLLCEELLAALEAAEHDTAVSVVTIQGMGKAFSAGGDIKEMHQSIKDNELDTIGHMAKLVFQIALTMKKMSKLVIVGTQGPVAGAAFNLVLAADLCIAADTSQFIQAFVKIGLVPDGGGMYLLTRSLGINKAMQLAVMGEVVSAEVGKDLGFVYQIVPEAELNAAVQRLAGELAQGPYRSYQTMKALIWESEFKQFESYGQVESQAQGQLGYTEDYKEGIQSFVDKRKPNFTGK